MKKAALILEGGAMRGIYTAGVLDFFMKRGLYFPYVLGVSAGACQAFSYISRQPGRSKLSALRYIRDPRYLSCRNLLREGSIFGFRFMFGDICHELLPFDYEAFETSSQEFVIGATNCVTGQEDFFYKSKCSMEKITLACIASSSMPLVSREIYMNDIPYLDGGVADSVPFERAVADGCEKLVVVLTRNYGYRKNPAGASARIAQRVYKKYPELVKAIQNRYHVYNDTMERIEVLERKGEIFVIRPTKPVLVKRMERSRRRLFAFYKEGMQDAAEQYTALRKFLRQ